jgi:predicted dehydrogenase
MPAKPILNVALVGYSFMGRTHSNAYQQVNRFFADCPFDVRRKVLIGRSQGPLEEAARTWGWEETATDLNMILGRDDIHLVDVATANDSHHDLSIAALKAGKHVLCEKPLALTVAQAREMLAVANKAKTSEGKPVHTGLWHNYRRTPAASTAAALIRDGKLGEIRHVRAVYLQDWLTDESCPATWRMTAKTCGSGAHGDLNAHLIDMTRFLTGLEFDEVSGIQETFIKKRRDASGGKHRAKSATKGGMITVDVDDALLFIARLSNGALASFEATRAAAGRKNYNRIEVNGTKGSIVWNFERMNELEYFSFEDEPRAQGFRTIMCMNGAAHPYAGNYWPDGHIIGYEHTFTNHLYDFLVALKSGKPFRPDFADGVADQEVIDAALESAKTHRWVKVERKVKFAKAAEPLRVQAKSAGIAG